MERKKTGLTSSEDILICNARERLGSDEAVMRAVEKTLKEYAAWYSEWAKENPEAALLERSSATS